MAAIYTVQMTRRKDRPLKPETRTTTRLRNGAATPTPAFGAEVRSLRKFRGMTLKQLSLTTGVSLSYLSVIERDAGNPSIDVLTAIAEALGVDVGWFFAVQRGEGPLERHCVVRANARRNLNTLYGVSPKEMGYADYLLSNSVGGRFYMGITTYAPRSDRPDRPLMIHEGEWHGVVIKGEMELTLGDEVITLHEGDSYTFDARIKHHGRNRTDGETVLVWAVSQVVIPREVEEKRDR